jgi:lipopolysaccharide biosynthesis glycosyltransferase
LAAVVESTPIPQPRRLVVVCATDHNYVEMTGVLLASLAHNSASSVSKVYVFGDGLDAWDEDLLRRSYRAGPIEIREVPPDIDRLIRRLPIRSHMTSSTYIKLFIPQLLPGVSDRILSLDCDIVVKGDLGPLARFDLGDYPVAAVQDAAVEKMSLLNRRIGLPPDTPYFNAGVLLFDPESWERAELTAKTIGYLNSRRDQIKLLDQDALNFVLRGNWYPLDRTWNYLEPSKRVATAARRGFADARIIHFVGRIKPDYADCPHPARDIYLEYRALSPWAGRPLKKAFGRNLHIRLNRWRQKIGRRVAGH